MNELKYRIIIILSAAWRRRYVICLPALIMPILGGLIGAMIPDTYRSHTSMLIQETAKMNPFLEDLAVSTQLTDRINALSTLLKSRHVLKSVALELNLADEATPHAEIERIIAKISTSLSVRQLGKDFIQIQLVGRHPEGMKALLESVSEHFIDQLLAPERSSIQDSSEFLTIHIEKRLKELNQAEQALAEFKNRYSDSTPEMQNQNLARLAALKQSLAEKEAELAGVEKSLGSLNQQLSKTNPVIGRIEDKIIEIRSELTLLRAKYTDNHSAVQAKKRELARLEDERATLISAEQHYLNSDQLWDIASSSVLTKKDDYQPLLVAQLGSLQIKRGRYESLKEETRSLAGMISDLEKRVNNFGDVARDLSYLQRDTQIKRELYDQLLERYEMAQLTGSLGMFEENKRVKIIDLPYTPSGSSNFPLIVYLVAGLFAGIALGISLATVTELFDTSVRRKEEIVSLTGYPVITTIPKVSPIQSH
ncbi:GumC family protein [Vibrio proteolyticus]|uniref:Putative exopolysaccharide biosynthesis protein n=1 Tax=Vibrio proteolyticus NBRC 13287 TaxID=1219065 RepID=U2ZV99_VIBPR|nr:exopolysaccharide biosynthesis protein [Vibrio proteolyticus]GAD65345.1 putative exopolysaccharide biosynthesis protein [Vibrio proteolyticus NBRC 13287]